MYGDAGDDFAEGGLGVDVVDGGDGYDTLDGFEGFDDNTDDGEYWNECANGEVVIVYIHKYFMGTQC